MASIEKLLIANRGEIAVRIARTAHRLGLSTVGVYSDADANAMHVDCVDTAIALGGNTAAESYLRGDVIIAAAVRTHANAIHPGYGFLAENATFAEQVADAGLIWVGPTPSQITLLGDKIAAKKAAVEAGVPTTPIFEIVDGVIPDGIGMPALVKAAAGGGGRGMRIVRSSEELAGAVEAAQREALSAFGDGTVFVEPYIERGRHIEVQIMADQHGNVIHLGERECSIQRRNQKVVEESPSAGITPETRAALCEGALALARHVGYQSAGTVEFLVDEDTSGVATINFLEVNTRLQVEHPVTEAVTGLDLVELQLSVAAGRPLDVSQDDVAITGHAIEVRVVAEDPAAGWLPSTGTISAFEIGDGVRVDTGIRAGTEVTPNYDSLLAKVISHAPDRRSAARQLARALRTSHVAGVRTNIDMAIETLGEADFLDATTPTAYLDEHPAVSTPSGPSDDDEVALLLGAVFATEQHQRGADAHHGFASSGFRNLRTQGQRQTWMNAMSGVVTQIEYTVIGPLGDVVAAEVSIGPWPVPSEDGSLTADERRTAAVRLLSRAGHRHVLEIDGRRSAVEHEIDGPAIRTRSSAGSVEWTLMPQFIEHDATAVGDGPISPLPGTVIAVSVEAGQQVEAGDILMVVEAMKMEHRIVAAAAANVTEVHFDVGDRVDQGALLVSLETREE